MTLMNEKIKKSEILFENTNHTKTALILILRYFFAYVVSKEENLLHKAYHIAVTSYKRNPSGIELYFLLIFLNIHFKNFEKSQDYLDSIGLYKNYFKNNEPLYYGIYMYLNAFLEIERNKGRVFRKYIKQLEEYSENKNHYLFPLLLGSLKLKLKEYTKANYYHRSCFQKGCRSVLLYFNLYEYFSMPGQLPANQELLVSFVNWGLAQGLAIHEIIKIQFENLKVAFSNHDELAEKLYANYPEQEILSEICINRMLHFDFSATAYQYYKQAELKQIQIPNLAIFMTKAAFQNNIEDTSRHSMLAFLKKNQAELDIAFKAYIYHLLLTNKKLTELSLEYKDEIIEFGKTCIENNYTGRYANSIYRFFIANREMIGQDLVLQVEKIVSKEIFTYEIKVNNSRIKYIWVGEKEKSEMKLYEVKDQKVKTRASQIGFSYFCFDGEMTAIAGEKIVITKMIENADLALYMYFYNRGIKNFEMMLYLSRQVLSLEKFRDVHINILNETLSLESLSQGFIMQINAALGNMLYTTDNSENSLDKALAFFKVVDINYLNEKYLEQMLTVFINTREYEKAVNILSKKSQFISDSLLFFALKQIAQEEKYHEQIADCAYEIILKSWYDKNLLDIVLQYYNGSQEEWQELSKALSTISVFELNLDEIILNNSIWMHTLDSGTQKIFIRLYENIPDNVLIEKFTYYLIYEIIINGFRPELETIDVLEKIYLQEQEEFLAYALSHVYLLFDVRIVNSEGVIKDAIGLAEKNETYFPVFKIYNKKFASSTYLEKNHPFLYKSNPNKNVFIYYKTDESERYRRQKMKYVKFGLYMTTITIFFGETIRYYFSEEMATGSITTKEESIENKEKNIVEFSADSYFIINNAHIYEQMFKYDLVEKTITESLKDIKSIRAKII